MRLVTLLAPVAALALHTAAGQSALRVLPTRYAGDRFFATPVATTGDTIVMLIDTGGGHEYAAKAVLERLGFTLKFALVAEGDSIFTGAKFPAFKPNAWIPLPIASRDSALYGVSGSLDGSQGAVGMLSNTWMAGRVWVFDYPHHQLAVYEPPPAPRPFGPHTIPMTLRDPPRTNHPRIQIVVAGDTIDVLLDTGATSTFTPAALALMSGGASTRGSAFVATRLFDKWHAAHPAWRVVAGGEAGMDADIIEVPSLRVAGYDTGPVWFAKRPNGAYDGMMKAVMDKPILASLGGPAFRTFRITLDYPNQRATFER